ncbi:MAG: phosphoribosyltransferase [Candidatus Kerfeldbacteria bacterium]|nr:phosphoribosyltransferase [Candidatus Kerfeldbacteria bacterium]
MEDLLTMLEQIGAIMSNDHFVGTSGSHFDTYINKDALYPYTDKVALVGQMFADKLKTYNVAVVAGPALGGIILSQWTAAALSKLTNQNVLSVYAEKKDGTLQLTRGYDKIVTGKNVAVVEDLTTTGGSLKKAVEAVQAAGGKVVVAAVMVNKNPHVVNSALFGVPFEALAEKIVQVYSPNQCQLCANTIPINTTIGHGKKFFEAKGK